MKKKFEMEKLEDRIAPCNVPVPTPPPPPAPIINNYYFVGKASKFFKAWGGSKFWKGGSKFWKGGSKFFGPIGPFPGPGPIPGPGPVPGPGPGPGPWGW